MARKDRSQRSRRNVPLERLRTLGDPALRAQTREITEFDERLKKLADTMLGVMHREDGVGLAAPQIGVLSRIMVWRDPEDDEAEFVFVNPHVVWQSEECETAGEGCLSLPECTIEVERPCRVKVHALDVDGTPIEFEGEGLVARIVQHETDHLDGKLILDRATPEERRRVMKELRERALDEL